MKLLSPPSRSTRPIIDRIKESIFDVLYKYDLIEGRNIADVFCGTGSFGLEALSRGAKSAAFIESDVRVIKPLKENISKAGFEQQANVFRSNAFGFIPPDTCEEDKFSLVFVDPPYASSRNLDEKSPFAGLVTNFSKCISDDGLIVLRSEHNSKPLDIYGGFVVTDQRKWGKMLVTLFKKDLKN